ncbi:MAG: hypothetical protein K2F78_01910, partial [Muribaculaceae bacterium]|nr:hypothetical protein [Muribaculaceae bacterium]
RIINLEKRGDAIASVCCVDADPEEEAIQIAPDAEELPALGADEEEIDDTEIVDDSEEGAVSESEDN